MKNAALSVIPKSATIPDYGPLYDLSGLEVDCADSTWRLNSASARQTINWLKLPIQSPKILEATVRYFRHLIETQSTAHAYNTFNALRLLLSSSAFMAADTDDLEIGFQLFTDIRAARTADLWRLHYVRKWYGWCAGRGYPNFSTDVAFEADQLQIPGNRKGHAVLSADPESGPLNDLELAALLTALRAAKGGSAMTLQQQVALWLCVALGPNPMQMALLTEDDIVELSESHELAFVHLRVPRMKKRDNEVRSAFRTRGLSVDIADAVIALRSENQSSASAADAGRSRPLFRRPKPRSDLLDRPLDTWAWHMAGEEFTDLVQSAVAALNVTSPRTGRPLQVTTRRLRYTFATRLVREGVSKLEVADLLDHTDTQNVQVYFDVKSDIVEHLDKAVAMTLAPIAQAFMGKLVSGADSAVRGGDPDSSIAAIRGSPKHVEKLGNCGSFGFCGLMAPIACYTCKSFQPWIDAPHHLVLDDLLASRQRRVASGLDGRMVSMHDTTICAVAEVITKIDAMRTVRP